MYYKLVLGLVLVLMNGRALAEENANIIGGDCSKTTDDHCSWSLNTTTGALTISGTGKMDDYKNESINGEQEYGYYYGEKTYYSSAPWGKYQVNSITIENGIENIGEHAFEGTNISTIKFPESVTSLGGYSFRYAKIQSVDIPASITKIERAAFQYADLRSIVIPEGVTSIGHAAFDFNQNLSEVILPSTLESIDIYAFGATNVTSLVIPENVKIINDILNPGDGRGKESNNIAIQKLYCTSEQMAQCEAVLDYKKTQDIKPIRYEKEGNNYMVYDDKGNIVGKYASIGSLQKGTATETYKYDSAGHLVGIFDGNGQRTWGKKIYTVEEAMEVTKNGDKFHVYLTYK